MSARGAIAGLLLSATISGCIPPGVRTGSDARASDRADAPAIPEPDIDTIYKESPVWEAKPVTVSARAVGASTYVVVSGDNLHRIGENTGAGADAIARENALSAPFTLQVGQQLRIPDGRFHRVEAGESGIAIARAYGVPWSEIIKSNGLADPFVLRVGQRLRIPDSRTPGEDSASRKASFRLAIDDILTGGEPADAVGTSPALPSARPRAPLSPAMSVREPKSFAGSFGWPVNGRIATRFGPAGQGIVNDGIDIAVAQGAPITASSDGVVAFVGNVAVYGGVILIRHGNGWITTYARAASAIVTRGQLVKRGQVIGTAGQGDSPLVHFEIRQGRVPVDPLKQLPAH